MIGAIRRHTLNRLSSELAGVRVERTNGREGEIYCSERSANLKGRDGNWVNEVAVEEERIVATGRHCIIAASPFNQYFRNR